MFFVEAHTFAECTIPLFVFYRLFVRFESLNGFSAILWLYRRIVTSFLVFLILNPKKPVTLDARSLENGRTP